MLTNFLTNEEIEEVLPSGRQRRFDNRVAWAKVYLERAGLLFSPKRGCFCITQEGLDFLFEIPSRFLFLFFSNLRNSEPSEKRQKRGSSKTVKSEKSLAAVPVSSLQDEVETPEESLSRLFKAFKVSWPLHCLSKSSRVLLIFLKCLSLIFY